MINDRALPPEQMRGARNIGRAAVKPKDLKGTLRRLIALTKGHRDGMGGILLLSACASVTTVFSPYITGKAVTAVRTQQPVKMILIMLLALYISEWLIKFLQQYCMAKIGQRMIDHIRRALFEKMRALPLRFFDRHRHGELMSRLTNDVDNISTTISNSLSQLLTYLFTLTGILVMMLRMSLLLSVVSLCGVGMVFLLTKIVTKHTRKLFAAQQTRLGVLNGLIEESVSGLSLVKAFNHEAELDRSFQEKNDELCTVSVRALIWSGYLMPITNVINNICYLIIAVLSAVLYVKGIIGEIGMITSFLLYVRQFTRPFVEIADIYNSFQTAVAGAERVFEIMDEQPEPEDDPNAPELKHPRGEVTFENVTFGYSDDQPVLKHIDLHIPAGTQVAVVGHTGSGKTTLINLLTRFYDVNEGRILLDRRDLREYKLADLRDCFGVVLQDTALFAVSVADNIAYGRPEASRREVEKAAETVGADGFIRRLPQGYDTVLEGGGSELSQGERQLLTIARALLSDAPLMILDEATSSVDTVTEMKIRKAMLEICRGRTSFIIAHRLSTVRDADIIILLEDGEIREMGSHRELLALGGRYCEMYRTQGHTD